MKTTLYTQNLQYTGNETSVINRISAIKGIFNISIKLQYDAITFEHESKKEVQEVKRILSKIGYSYFDKKNDLYKNMKSNMIL